MLGKNKRFENISYPNIPMDIASQQYMLWKPLWYWLAGQVLEKMNIHRDGSASRGA